MLGVVVRGRRWRVLVPLGVALGISYGGVQQSVHGLLTHARWNWPEMLVVGGTWALLWPPGWCFGHRVARRAVDRGWLPRTPARRRWDEQQTLIRPAVETGALPPDAQPELWRPALRAAIRELTTVGWVFGVWSVVVAGLIGAAAVANGNAWGIWAIAAVVLAEGALASRWVIQHRRPFQRLLAQLPG